MEKIGIRIFLISGVPTQEGLVENLRTQKRLGFLRASSINQPTYLNSVLTTRVIKAETSFGMRRRSFTTFE